MCAPNQMPLKYYLQWFIDSVYEQNSEDLKDRRSNDGRDPELVALDRHDYSKCARCGGRNLNKGIIYCGHCCRKFKNK
jgi:hypothetical protein